MISIDEADKRLSKIQMAIPSEKLPLEHSIGRILDEPIYADRDFPPFDRVTMDGIAIQYDSLANGSQSFPIEGVAPAGSPIMRLENPNACLEVMTGAIMPHNADTVIPYEQVQIQNDIALIQTPDLVTRGKNIHLEGRDRIKGSLLIPKGVAISPAEIAIMATVGASEISVKQMRKVAVIATGDELVGISETPAPHQIRSSNVYMLKSALKELGLDAQIFHLKDDKESLQNSLKEILDGYDIILLSGGVSKGKFDYVPEVMTELGVEKVFHKIKQKPGKPFWLGRRDGKVVFAFPGNPVSSFMCFNRYFKKWLYQQLEVIQPTYTAHLATDFSFPKELTYFLQVKVEINDSGQIIAHPNTGNGSGDLANLISSHGFLELPKDQFEFKAGMAFTYHPYRPI